MITSGRFFTRAGGARVALGAVMGAGALCCGCAGGAGGTSAVQTVGAEAFVETGGAVGAPKLPAAVKPRAATKAAGRAAPPPPPPAPPASEAAADLSAAPLETASIIGRPAPSGVEAHATGNGVVLESLVGQVNGRPIFASEILEPLDDQLRAEAKKATGRKEWLQVIAPKIRAAVRRVIENELILAEARASLTPEQKQGLFHFLTKIQEDLVSQQQGSQVAADDATRTSHNLNLQQASKERLDEEMIGNEIRQRISPRVIVSWRQIEQEYDRNNLAYNPRPVASYRLISARKADAAAKVKADLESGRAWGEVAGSDLNELAGADGGRQKLTLTGKPDQRLFAFAELDEAAKPLAAGQVSGPVVVNGTTYWVGLESIEQAAGVSLYDAQLDIDRQLRAKRFEAETGRYFERLQKRGNVSKTDDILVRLMVIAEQRYFPGAVAAKPQ